MKWCLAICLAAVCATGMAEEQSTEAPTLKELVGKWVVDSDKLTDANATYSKEQPDEVARAKKYMSRETFEFSEGKLVFQFDDMHQDMTIVKHRAHTIKGEPCLLLDTFLKQTRSGVSFEQPHYEIRIYRMKSGILRLEKMTEPVGRPLKRPSK